MKKAIISSGVSFLAMLPLVCAAAEPSDVASLFKEGKPYAELRYRYEHVEQVPFTKDADASTLRAVLGYQTGIWNDLQGLIEFETTSRLGNNTYNDSVNGHTAYPAVTDPVNHELNQVWASWAGLPQTTLKGGRQSLSLDNQRFVGPVAWRQNNQTFDSVVITNNTVKDLALLYGYVWNVNRVVGDKNILGDYDTQTHLLHGEYSVMPELKIAGYGYFLNIDNAGARNLSSRTLGLRFTGEHSYMQDVKFSYTLEGAQQTDYRNSALDYRAGYFHLVPGVTWQNWTAQAGYEVLGGNGVSAFQTPLATLHAFNGWADKFTTTPANGLEDAYGRLAYKVSGVHPSINGTVLEVIYHNFDAEDVSTNYGHEWNAQISKTFKGPDDLMPPYAKEWTISLKYADFQGDNATAYKDTTKTWLTLSTKF